jgi:hypothetical protein
MFLRGLLIRVLTGQSDNRVAPIKLSDGPCSQSGKDTLRQLNRAHFPQSAGVEITLKGQRQQNLRAFAAHTEDWELFTRIIDQSETRREKSTFTPLKLPRTAGILPARLQQGVDHLTNHPHHIF